MREINKLCNLGGIIYVGRTRRMFLYIYIHDLPIGLEIFLFSSIPPKFPR